MRAPAPAALRMSASSPTAITRPSSIAIARNLSGLALSDLGGRVQIQLTFAYRNLTRTYTLIGIGP